MLLLTLISCFDLTAFARTADQISVYVTISDKDGKLVLAQEKITVTDTDNDEKLTVNDALYAAHDAAYEGGAAAGFASSMGQYGLQLDKLWGSANGGSYGYYVNNVASIGLGDEVKEGDCINAYVYTDLTAWSDLYTYFDVNTVSADAGKAITLTLCAAGYDAEWNPVVFPVEGAVITVNGESTEVKTDSKGSATVQIADGGRYVISAVCETQVLVPPVCIATVASAASAKVYVTISDKAGKLALVQEEIIVTDTDKDGVLTINDALYAAHEAKYEGGAAAGYASSYGAYGLSMNKLWGTENGGSYGYCVNNSPAWSLTDIVKEGDYINAYVYTDLTAWSDSYCYFNVNEIFGKAGGEMTLTLSMAGYDEAYNPIVIPVADAFLTINGEKTAFKTDQDGNVTFTVSDEGSYIISAVSDTLTLVPPVCKATVTATGVVLPEPAQTSPKTGTNVDLFLALFTLSLSGIAILMVMRKKSYEK